MTGYWGRYDESERAVCIKATLAGAPGSSAVQSAVDGRVLARDQCSRVARSSSGSIANITRQPFAYSSVKIEHLYGSALLCTSVSTRQWGKG